MIDETEIITEFLIESHENLDQLDREFVALEGNPAARERVASIFRTIHTIKGTAGFLGFHNLEALTHAGEHLLSCLRDGKLALDATMTSGLLQMVDAVRGMLTHVEAHGTDGEDAHANLVSLLNQLATPGGSAGAETAAAPPAGEPGRSVAQLEAKASPRTASIPPRAPSTPPRAPSTPPRPEVAKMSVRPPAAAPPFQPQLADIALLSAPPPGTGANVAEAQSSVSDSSVRVDVALLDKLMNLVGELVLARNQILQHAGTLRDAGLQSAAQSLNMITSELQEGVMKTRMQPIGNIWGKLPRVVRDLAVTCKKQARLEMSGEDTELDRTIIEAIKDPLTHLVRNALDHGIETPEVRLKQRKPAAGKLSLRAFHEGGHVNIELADDGAGIDPERIRQLATKRGLMSSEHARRLSDREIVHLIFAPGFSTAEKVTNVSGRGVGMDVVKTNIEKIGGTVDVQSRIGQGTTVKIKIPLTLAIIPALVVTSGGERFAIPQVSLLELVRLEGAQLKQIEHIHGAPVYRLRGSLLPLVYLSQALGLAAPGAHPSDVINIVVVRADERQFGLVVEGISDTEEIVVKPLGKELKGISAFAGATIMGDGRVALILDVLGLAQRARVISEVRDRGLGNTADKVAVADEERRTLLLFRVKEQGRMAIPLSRVARLEEFDPASLEWSGGHPVVQYRGEILQLIDLRETTCAPAANGERPTPLQVVVYSEEGRSVGMIVGQILDIVSEVVGPTQTLSTGNNLSALVIQGRVTDLLDARSVIEARHPGIFGPSRAA
jgi:two-component system chemotaxis sensor kinase CheA